MNKMVWFTVVPDIVLLLIVFCLGLPGFRGSSHGIIVVSAAAPTGHAHNSFFDSCEKALVNQHRGFALSTASDSWYNSGSLREYSASSAPLFVVLPGFRVNPFHARKASPMACVLKSNVGKNAVDSAASEVSSSKTEDCCPGGGKGTLAPPPAWNYQYQGYDWKLPPAAKLNEGGHSHVVKEAAYGWVCASNGHRQSPIDIEDSETIDGPASKDVEIQYNLPNMGLDYNNDYVMINIGTTIQIEPDTTLPQSPNSLSNNRVYVDGVEYSLKQFHFHSPAEHTINGRPFGDSVADNLVARANVLGNTATSVANTGVTGTAGSIPRGADVLRDLILAYDGLYHRRYLEMHLVHAPTDPSGNQGLVVIGITFVVGDHRNSFLDQLAAIPYFPAPYMHTVTQDISTRECSGRIPVSTPFPSLDLVTLLRGEGHNGRLSVYTYEGSLTTPPLSETVKWFVVRDPVSATLDQMSSLRAAMNAAGGKGNYRLIQNSKLVRNNSAKVQRVFGHLNQEEFHN